MKFAYEIKLWNIVNTAEVRDNTEGELDSLGDKEFSHNTRSCPCILIVSISLMSWDSIIWNDDQEEAWSVLLAPSQFSYLALLLALAILKGTLRADRPRA